jgi:plasmid stabilization system protein ParE
MKPFAVIFSDDAVADLTSSVEWGLENWGDARTWMWYSDLKKKIVLVLSTAPLAQPPAPDGDAYEIEVRQLTVGRYRVLFAISKRVVTILHVRGPYSGS